MTAINGQIFEDASAGSWIAPVCASDISVPSSSYARGACPSLSTPMMTGDGLLVRLRPTSAGLTFSQLRLLAEAAGRHGNGIVEITARGNLQLRGLKSRTIGPLSDEISRAGIIAETGVTIEVPPLSDIDPHQIADARALATSLRQTIAGLETPLLLAPKFTIVVDGGGLLSLDGLSADIRLKAVHRAKEAPAWNVAIGGTAQTARSVGAMPQADAIPAVLDMLKVVASLGYGARGRDLDIDEISRLLSCAAGPPEFTMNARSPVGLHHLACGKVVLGLGLGFGQIRAAELIAVANIAESHGAQEVRMAPGHAMLVLGLDEKTARALQLAAANFGLLIDPQDVATAISACAGEGACASGLYHTKMAATEFLGVAGELLDGSIRLHFTGCPKGCAHPGSADIAVVGTPTGYGLVVNGVASAEPLAYIGKNGLQSALQAVARLVHDKKDAGESVSACLKRLAADDIVTALRQG